jgi:hypothetical protein
MQLKYSIKRAALVVGLLTLVSITAVAQQNRSEISIQGTGFFTKDTAGNGVFERANETGGFLLGYRYNLNRWLAAEANYGYDRNTQFYFGGTPARVQSNIHQITGSAVVKLPSSARLQPHALAGAGALVFDPTGISSGSFAGAKSLARYLGRRRSPRPLGLRVFLSGLHKRSILSIQLRFRRPPKAAQPQVMSLVSRLPNLAAIGPLLRPG